VANKVLQSDGALRRKGKRAARYLLGELPFAAEMYWQLYEQGKAPLKRFALRRTERWLPDLLSQAQAARQQFTSVSPTSASPRRRILLFGMLRYWIENATLLGLALAGLGHEVTLLYLPYPHWHKPVARFDARRLSAYTQKVLSKASPLLQSMSLLELPEYTNHRAQRVLPQVLDEAIQELALRDTQYTLQVEKVDRDGTQSSSAQLYHLRLERNRQAANAVLAWVQSLSPEQRPELVLTPNGSILEMGAIYQVARYLNIPAVTYEFGEQRGRIWLAKDDEVMRQDTDDLWAVYKDRPLEESQWERIRALYASRKNASLWENFSRLWQGLPSQGREQVRQALNLDSRPVVLLPANVIGDSLTLGRQVFSENMTEWLERTVQMFAQRDDVQLVVRIHPGERYTKGPSVAEVVHNVLPEMPANIRLVQALDPINTYDLIEVADLGLAYTTTVGMEIAMSGVPVIVAGETHYRGKGFTLDPTSWEHYGQLLEEVLTAQRQAKPSAYRLTRQQLECAWQYAYRFFFDYPCPFPWHLHDWWKELETWSLARALSSEGQALFGDAFRYLAGEPRQWSKPFDVPTVDGIGSRLNEVM
jgi:hypothetical protein